MTTVAVSGGFDPLHVGHLKLFDGALKVGWRLAVIVDSDEFILAKGRRPLMPQAHRVELLRNVRGVSDVWPAEGPDACSALEAHRPDIYCVGADHADGDFPEFATCKRLGIRTHVLRHDREDVRSSLLLSEQARGRWVNPPVTVDGLATRWGRELLVCRRGPAAGGEGLLDLPGGFLEPGETLEECLRREVKEELRAAAYLLEYRLSQVAYARDGRRLVNVIFDCKLHGEPKPTPEVSEVLWCGRMPEGEWYSECCRLAAEGWFRERAG